MAQAYTDAVTPTWLRGLLDLRSMVMGRGICTVTAYREGVVACGEQTTAATKQGPGKA